MKYVAVNRRIVTTEESRAIQASPKSNAELAREYRLHPSTISRIKSGR